MRLITEPKVYLVGRQTVDDYQLAEFLQDHGVETWETDTLIAGQKLTETAGRVCYMSFAKPRPGGNAAYLGHIKEVGHGSVLEHAAFNLIVTGVSRSLTHELVRHRAGMSYSMLSQRYVDESVAEYVVPPDLQQEIEAAEACKNWCVGFMETSGENQNVAYQKFRERHPQYTAEMLSAGFTWLDAVRHSHEKYVALSDYLAAKAKGRGLQATEGRKFARQAARSVLPNATETKIFVTLNARSARHFIEQRGSRNADPEIRVLAGKVYDVLLAEAPNLFNDYRKERLPDGTFELTTEYPKV